jgi:ATP-binding cassette subfamily B protein
MTGYLAAGVLTLCSLVMYVQAVQRGQTQIGALVTSVIELHQAALFLTTFEEVLRLPARVTAPAAPRPVPTPIRRGIVFDRVSFAYPGTERLVLDNLSFTLGVGGRLAVVGANGAGKSTLVKLLCRLYDPTSGRILVDGVDLRELDPADWRRCVGVLFQDFGRYQLTAAENIWIGDPQGTPADARIAAAATRAGLDEVVRHWPQGLETPLGRWLRPGVEPSMGQWQRLALARAMLREAQLLVLDEPTSALDARTQQEFINLLLREAAERPALVVSHRPEMLAWARHVIVLHDGTVVEEGDAATLLRQQGALARLFPEAGDMPETA